MAERVYTPKANELPITFKATKRFWELDFLRGMFVVFMVIDHFFFSADVVLQFAVWEWWQIEFWPKLALFAEIYWVNNARCIARFALLTMFFLICGISCTLSHNNLRRGLKTLGAGIVITMVTWLADSVLQTGLTIVFGVIHMLGCAMLLVSLFDLLGWGLGWLIKTKKTQGLADWTRRMLPCVVGIVGLLVYFLLPLGHFGRETWNIVIDGKVVEFFYTDLITDVTPTGKGVDSLIHLFVEVSPAPFASADYFAIMPWAFLVMIGSGIGQLVYRTRAKTYLSRLDGKWNKPVCFIGRHALLFYLLHQVAIAAFFFAAGGIYYLLK